MMACPYDTNGDGDCFLCADPPGNWLCDGRGPVKKPENYRGPRTAPPCPPEETFEIGPFVPLDQCGHDHGPSVFSEWYCQADAVGITTTHCSPENPIHSPPCGWMT